jgi:uncharacterized membrane protein YdbT with pleckstrin-like domain
MAYVDRNMLADERVIYRTRLHWILFARSVLVMLAGLVLALLPWWYGLDPMASLVGLAIVLVGLAMAVVTAVRVLTSEFAVTTMRIVMKVGLIAIHTDEMLLQKVETIGVDQSIWGRLLGYGTVTITGTGGAREPFAHVRDPIGFRRAVQEQSVRR